MGCAGHRVLWVVLIGNIKEKKMLDEVIVSIKQKEKLPKESGIYGIRNLVNGKIYVGSSKNIYKRTYEHIRLLKKEKHTNTYLQKSYSKYGAYNFIIFVIEICDTDNLLQKEDFYINQYNSKDREFGYNLMGINPDDFGYIHTEETRNKRVKSLKKRYKENPRTQITHCKYGHEFTEENTRIKKNGRRNCQTCYLEYRAKRRRIEKEERNYKKTHCRNGHLATEENTYVNPNTLKILCSICKKNRDDRWFKKKYPLKVVITRLKPDSTHFNCGHLIEGNTSIHSTRFTKSCIICNRNRARLSHLKNRKNKNE